ncbi:MAG: DUF2891 domain-containing protein [Saprospiraceae bacterium]
MKINNILFLSFLLLTTYSCTENTTDEPSKSDEMPSFELKLDLAQANRLASLPLSCIQQEYPNKMGAVYEKESDIGTPKGQHPAFYGCFDWHSAVHGHWVLVRLLKAFPDLDNQKEIRQQLSENLTAENIKAELAYFELNPFTSSYERTYGWAWLLQLATELENWEDEEAQTWYQNLKPLADLIIEKYKEYLPKLNYPIRVGEHTNTAFGLTFAWDYGKVIEDKELLALIEKRAKDFYLTDENCPISWEPSGYDFLSPCLEEADLMRRVLPETEFKTWFKAFKPFIELEPATVSDRSDGKLVHLDGLNFSRAWCLYGIANQYPEYNHLKEIADKHLDFSLGNIVDGDYAGQHWLGSFALYALDALDALDAKE